MLDILNFFVDEVGLTGLLLIAAILSLIFGGGPKRRVLGVLLLVMSMPVTSRIAGLPLDVSTLAFDTGAPRRGGDAVAVYGAGVFADKTGGMWPSARSLERASVGLALSRRLGLPLVVSGGIVRPDLDAESVVLSNVMRLPADTVLEAKARTTAENAEFVAVIAAERGWRSVILVTSREHTRRALAASRSAGLDVADVVDASSRRPIAASDFLPGPKGLSNWSPVAHEYAGILWYVLSGRIGLWDIVGD